MKGDQTLLFCFFCVGKFFCGQQNMNIKNSGHLPRLKRKKRRHVVIADGKENQRSMIRQASLKRRTKTTEVEELAL